LGGGTAIRIGVLTAEGGGAGRGGFVYFIHGTINILNLFRSLLIRRHLRQNLADDNDSGDWDKKKSSKSHDKDIYTFIQLSGPKGPKLSTICKYLVHMSLEARGTRRHDSNKSSMVRETTELNTDILDSEQQKRTNPITHYFPP
jgi:hypothetical protein